MDEVRVEESVAATPLALYELVSDVTSMGRWSPETAVCRWLGDATGPAVGARFKGSNRKGWRRWSTTCTVTHAEPGRRFAFDVGYGQISISRWAYEFEADGDRCRVIETWNDRRPGWMVRLSAVIMGIPDRAAHNRQTMTATLAQLRRVAEANAANPTQS